MIQVEWSTLKSFVDSKQLRIQEVEEFDRYHLYANDNTFCLYCCIPTDVESDAKAEYEANYQETANSPITQLDTDGAQIVRVKAAKKGWTYQALNFEFSTAALSSSLYCKDVSDNDVPGFTMKAYNSSNEEVTTAGESNANLATIVKTVIDFEPPYDYEVIGGKLRTETSIAENLRMWIMAVPDIAAAYGGSKEMATCINLKYLAPQNVYEVDGRVSKYLTYNNSLHTNKLRFIFIYPAGTAENLSITIEYYKQ